MYPFLSPKLREVCPYKEFHDMLDRSEDNYVLRNYIVEKMTLSGDSAKAVVRTTGFPPSQLFAVPTATRMDEYEWVQVSGRWYLKSWYITSLRDGKVYTTGMADIQRPTAPAGPSREELERERLEEKLAQTERNLRRVIEALETYYRQNDQFPTTLSELPKDVPIDDPFAEGQTLRYFLNPRPPACAIVVSNGPDETRDYNGEGFDAEDLSSYPRPHEAYDPNTGQGDLYLFTTADQALEQ